MAIEKLLIFGVALAILAAVATLADTTGTTRETEKTDYITEMNALKAKAPWVFFSNTDAPVWG
ncbi:MAG: hypothetical protein ABJI00_18685 [Paracoccaceae bacterium]